jgi:hypothetical protein
MIDDEDSKRMVGSKLNYLPTWNPPKLDLYHKNRQKPPTVILHSSGGVKNHSVYTSNGIG